MENKNRISGLVKYSTSINTSYDLSPKWKELLKIKKELYEKFSINCTVCTYKNKNTSNTCNMCQSSLKDTKIVSLVEGDTTYMNTYSVEVIESLLHTITYVLNKQLSEPRYCFILSRPPGHHSDNNSCVGFCIVNNISFAIDHLRENGKQRIFILDWDVHQGNGTQSLYKYDKDIIMLDIHRRDIYPFKNKAGNEKEDKDEENINIINVPLEKGSDESVYINVLLKYLPDIKKFNPDWVIVSCGFDAHVNDPIGGMKLESSSYKKFHDILKSVYDCPITYFLEGGYNCKAITESILYMLS